MENKVVLQILGNQIRTIREKQNITQSQLAHATGQDEQEIQELEAGNIDPDFYQLIDLAKGLGTDLKTLLDLPL